VGLLSKKQVKMLYACPETFSFEICVTIKLGTKLISTVTCQNDKSTVLGVPETHSEQLGSAVIGVWNIHLANYVASSKPLVPVTV